jgi:glycosyltransferase involved in cell wall biosynthesis
VEAIVARFILINRYFYPDDAATSHIAMALSIALTARGWTVDAVTGRQLYNDPDADLLPTEKVHGIRINRVWTTRMGRGRLLGRGLDYLAFYANAFGWLLQHARRGDVILALTDPPLISVLAGVVAALRGCTQINWLHDLFPEIAHAVGVLPTGLVYRTLLSLRNWSIRRAAANVAIGEGMARHLLRHGVPDNRVVVIHNWSNGTDVAPVLPEQNRLREAWGLSGKFVAGYSGNLGRVHDYKTIIDAAELLRDDPEVRFLFIGGGHFIQSVEAEATRRALTNITIKPYQPRSRLSEILSVPDLHLISLLPMLEGLVVPSKFYGIAAAGRPSIFIGKRSGEIPRLLRDAKCGTTVATGDGVRLARHIKHLQKNSALRALWGQNARAVLDLRFDEQLGLAKWLELIQSLAANQAAPLPNGLRLRDSGRRAAEEALDGSAPLGTVQYGSQRGRQKLAPYIDAAENG